MKIYRIRDVSKSTIHDDEFVDIVRYINTYARRGWRCCQIFCGYILEGSQRPKLVSKKKVIRHGAGVYVRIPHYREVLHMDIYVSYVSSLEFYLIKKYIGGIKDFIAANGDRFVGPIGTVVTASWIPAVNFKAYKYRLTYRTNKFIYPRIPWDGRIAYMNSCNSQYSPYECTIVFKEPNPNIIATFFLYRADHDNIEECERYIE